VTNRQMAYKARLSEFEDGKASQLGAYLPSVLEMEEGEYVLDLICPGDYSGHLLMFYEDGKVGRVELSAFATKTNRKRLQNAYCDKSPLVKILQLDGEADFVVYTSDDRALLVPSALLAPKTTRNTQGVAVVRQAGKRKLTDAVFADTCLIRDLPKYRVKSIPSAGAALTPEDKGIEQLTIDM
ncbi:MAG: topoisomerase IV, partial [Oscillospiraceae bacterium]|nr:topoisomerase IV [Oscillospiraceae bacterium]